MALVMKDKFKGWSPCCLVKARCFSASRSEEDVLPYTSDLNVPVQIDGFDQVGYFDFGGGMGSSRGQLWGLIGPLL